MKIIKQLASSLKTPKTIKEIHEQLQEVRDSQRRLENEVERIKEVIEKTEIIKRTFNSAVKNGSEVHMPKN